MKVDSQHWPPRSPDLSVLDFLIWGTIKSNQLNSTDYQGRLYATSEEFSDPIQYEKGHIKNY